jgi:hypothetical protein
MLTRAITAALVAGALSVPFVSGCGSAPDKKLLPPQATTISQPVGNQIPVSRIKQVFARHHIDVHGLLLPSGFYVGTSSSVPDNVVAVYAMNSDDAARLYERHSGKFARAADNPTGRRARVQRVRSLIAFVPLSDPSQVREDVERALEELDR